MNIKEVARQAQVSVATVSRVLNHPELVQPETREHVLEVMERFHYTPNWFARGLNLGHTNTIALLIPGFEHDFYQKAVSGVETVAAKKGCTVFLCNTHGTAEGELASLKMVLDRRVDGVILGAPRLSRAQFEELGLPNQPFVVIGKGDGLGDITACYINFEGIAQKLTRHLFDMGHRRIDLLLDEQSHSKSESIIAGYQRAVTEAGAEQGQFHTAEDSLRGGYLAAKRLFATGEIPDAIFASSDDLAFGVIKAARDEGVQIPERVAVTGFDDSPLCELITPELTSVEIPANRLGMVAARLLFDLIEDAQESSQVPQQVALQPKMKIRRSCGNKKYIYELFE